MGFIGRSVAPAPISASDVPDLPASKITSGAFDSARLTNASFDDNKIVNDLSTLGLRVHTQENLNASNTSSASFDVFQDSSGIENLTNCSRNDGEFIASVVTTTGAYSSDSNTLALLHFDGSQNGTTFTDSSSHNRTITRYNSPVTKTDVKKYGTASGNFNGSDEALSMPDSDSWIFGTNDWTMETWVYITSLPGSHGYELFGQAKTNSSDVGGSFHWTINTSDKQQFNVYQRNSTNNDDDFNHASTSSMTTNTWTHLAVVRDGNTIRFYKNGVADGTGAVPSSSSYHLFTGALGGDVWISKRAYNNSYGYLPGYLDEFRISNTCRYPNGTTFTPQTQTTSNATGSFEGATITAGASTSKMGAVLTYQDNAGVNTLNTDIILKLSADNGSNYSTATLTALPDFATGIKMAKVNDLSVTSGTQLKYKIEFSNQSLGSKEARIRGVSLQY